MDQAPTTVLPNRRRIFRSRNIFVILTFRHDQVPEFNNLDEPRSLFSNMLRCAPKVQIMWVSAASPVQTPGQAQGNPRAWQGFCSKKIVFFSKHFLLHFVQEILQYFTVFTIYSYLKLNKKPKGGLGCMVVPILPMFSSYSQYGIYF